MRFIHSNLISSVLRNLMSGFTATMSARLKGFRGDATLTPDNNVGFTGNETDKASELRDVIKISLLARRVAVWLFGS